MDFLFVQLRAIKTSCVLFSHTKVPGSYRSHLLHLANHFVHFTPFYFLYLCSISENCRDQTYETGDAAGQKWKLFRNNTPPPVKKKTKTLSVLTQRPSTWCLIWWAFQLSYAYVCHPLLRCGIKRKKKKTSSRNKTQTAAWNSHLPPGVVMVPSTTKVTSLWKSSEQKLTIKVPLAPILKG